MKAAATPAIRIVVLATGGTIEKHYDPHAGALALGRPVLEQLLERLVQPDADICFERLMALDSLDMHDSHREQIVAAVQRYAADPHTAGIVITHGTDTLAETARLIADRLADLPVPVVLTGAMVPYLAAASDAAQNLAQALLAVRLLAPGVYGVFHGRAIAAALIAKDHDRLTFIDSQAGC